MKEILFTLLTPWKLAGGLVDRKGRRALIVPVLCGVLLGPVCLGVMLISPEWKVERNTSELSKRYLGGSGQDKFPAPQAGLMKMLSKGVVRSEPPPLPVLCARIAGLILAWWGGGVLAVFIGCSLLVGMMCLIAQSGVSRSLDIVFIRRIVGYASLLFIPGGVCWVLFSRMYTGMRLSGTSPSPWVLVISGALALWVVFAFGAIHYGWRLGLSGRNHDWKVLAADILVGLGGGYASLLANVIAIIFIQLMSSI